MILAAQSITSGDTNTVITFNNRCNSLMIANSHVTDDILVDLWLSGKASTDVARASVGAVYINLASGLTGYATGETGAMVIDNGSGSASPASTAAFLNERVYKTDGTFIGKCTAITTTALTVGGGIETMIANNDEIYLGNRYYILNNVKIPNGTSLRLEGDEINFSTNNYVLMATSNLAGCDFIFR